MLFLGGGIRFGRLAAYCDGKCVKLTTMLGCTLFQAFKALFCTPVASSILSLSFAVKAAPCDGLYTSREQHLCQHMHLMASIHGITAGQHHLKR